MSYTGMRLGELSALRWSDIDYKNKTIIINSTMYSKIKIYGFVKIHQKLYLVLELFLSEMIQFLY